MNIEPNWSKFVDTLRGEADRVTGRGPGGAGATAAFVLYGIADALEKAIPDPNKGLKPYR